MGAQCGERVCAGGYALAKSRNARGHALPENTQAQIPCTRRERTSPRGVCRIRTNCAGRRPAHAVAARGRSVRTAGLPPTADRAIRRQTMSDRVFRPYCERRPVIAMSAIAAAGTADEPVRKPVRGAGHSAPSHRLGVVSNGTALRSHSCRGDPVAGNLHWHRTAHNAE
jgi:hypothetical protein